MEEFLKATVLQMFPPGSGMSEPFKGQSNITRIKYNISGSMEPKFNSQLSTSRV
jgi:hypothetical protein